MTDRITQADLKDLLSRINYATLATPYPAYGTVGAYVLDYAYGGVKLAQVVNEQGGERTISTGGYGTKRELYVFMRGMLSGMGE